MRHRRDPCHWKREARTPPKTKTTAMKTFVLPPYDYISIILWMTVSTILPHEAAFAFRRAALS